VGLAGQYRAGFLAGFAGRSSFHEGTNVAGSEGPSPQAGDTGYTLGADNLS
jgi:hypothetical protein